MGVRRGVVLRFLPVYPLLLFFLLAPLAGGDRVDDAPERIARAGEDVEFRCPVEGQGEIGEAAICNIFSSSFDH